MPTATTSEVPTLPRARAWPTTSRVLAQISLASCSTHPARGKICWCSFWPTETTAPSWSKIMQRVLVVPWSMAATYWLTVVPLASSRWGWAELRSEGGPGQQAAQDGPDERADDRHPGVAPVAVPLAADRQHGVRDARAQVAGGVEGVAGRSAEGGADADDEQRHRQRAELAGRVAEAQDEVDEHEGADGLGDHVPGGAGDRRAGGEGAEHRFGRRVVLLAVGQPGDDGAEERADELTEEIDHRRRQGDRHAGRVLVQIGRASCRERV